MFIKFALILLFLVAQVPIGQQVDSKGVQLQDNKKVLEVVEKAEREVVKSPTSSEAHYNLGFTYFKAGLVQKAEESFKKALSIKPDYVDVLIILAQIEANKKNFDSARELAQKARKVSPNDARVYGVLGGISLSLGEIVLAEENFEKAIKLDPNLPDVHFNLANIYEEGGSFQNL